MAKGRENDLGIKGYIYPDDEIYKIFEDDDPVYLRIINSPEFLRLKDISFLGTIDVFDLFDTKYKFSRYDHSIGVAVLAKKIAGELGLDKKKTKTLIIACLLHDIGHPPLSHSLEPIFIKYTHYRSNGHHTQTRRLIVGNLRYHSKFNLTFLHKILKNCSIDISEVSSLLGGEGDPILKSLLENPFSPDSIDGINRAALTFGEKPVAAEDILKSFSLMNSEVVLDLNYKNILDAFWSLKNRLYSHYIYDPKNLMAEHFLCELFEKIANDVENFKDLVFMTDNDFLSYLFNHKKIQSFLNEVWNSSNSLEVPQNNSSVPIPTTSGKRELKEFVRGRGQFQTYLISDRVNNKSFGTSLIKLSDAKKGYIRSYSSVNLPNDTKTLHMLEQKIRNNYLLKNGKKVVVGNEQNRIFGAFSGSITKNRFE